MTFAPVRCLLHKSSELLIVRQSPINQDIILKNGGLFLF